MKSKNCSRCLWEANKVHLRKKWKGNEEDHLRTRWQSDDGEYLRTRWQSDEEEHLSVLGGRVIKKSISQY